MAIAMGWRKPDHVAGSSAPAIMVGLFVASGGLLFGYDIGAINGILAMRAFKDKFGTCHDKDGNLDICTAESALIVAILSAGAVAGALIAAPILDSIGRRLTLFAALVIFCVGSICQVCASDEPLMLVGRALAGMGVGAISALVPLYQSETAPKWIRGTLVCAYQFSITIGLFLASLVNFATCDIKSSAAYRIPLGVQLVPAVILACGIIILPETPRFLVRKGQTYLASISLSRLRRLDITHPALIDELQEIEANHQYELSLGPDSYKSLIFGSPHLGRRTLTGCGLQTLQQLTGTNFLMYFSTTFFDSVGMQDAYIKSLVINIVNVVSTLPGILIIESWGRRKLLMTGATGIAFCQLFMATYASVAGPNMASTQVILFAFCVIDIFFYAASWGPVTWVVTSEIYPLKIRAKAISISAVSNWIFNFVIAYTSPFMARDANFGVKIFFVWGTFCVLAVVFVWCMVYETSKISLEQVDELYERVPRAWHSPDFVPTWSFQQILDDGGPSDAHPPPTQGSQSTGGEGAFGITLDNMTSSNDTINSVAQTLNNNGTESIKSETMIAHVDFSY